MVEKIDYYLENGTEKDIECIKLFYDTQWKKNISAPGLEPWKHHVLELEPSSFDHSGILTKNIFSPILTTRP